MIVIIWEISELLHFDLVQYNNTTNTTIIGIPIYKIIYTIIIIQL